MTSLVAYTGVLTVYSLQSKYDNRWIRNYDHEKNTYVMRPFIAVKHFSYSRD